MKRFLVLLLTAALLAGLCGCAATKTEETSADQYIVVGFSQVGAESDWRVANTLSMQGALSEKNGYKLIIDDAQNK